MTDRSTSAVVPGRVVLHAGLHKTGTTTIQTALLRGGDFAYPMPERLGPGHADLAERTLGFGPYHDAADPDALTDAVHAMTVAHGRAVPVVISSEVFVRALGRKGRTAAFGRLAIAHPTELVLTLRPDHERLASVAAQLVVGGGTAALDGYWRPALANPTMKPRAVPRFLALAPWSAVHVVLIDPEDPDHLFRAFEDIIGARIARVAPQNTRWSALALMIMTELNRTNPDLDHVRRGRLALKAARIVESDPETGDGGSLPAIPTAVLEELRERWAQDVAEIRALHADGVIRLHERSSSGNDGGHPRTPAVARPADRVVAVAPGPPTSTQRARLVLHVGPPKTGTSAFQVFLAQNPEALRRIGLMYPEGDAIAKARDGGITAGNARSIALHFNPRFTAGPGKRFPHDATGRGALHEELREFAQQSDLDQGGRSVILSSEYFGDLSQAGIDDLGTVVEKQFSDTRILSVLREPSDLLGSLYAQRVKSKALQVSLPDFWEQIGRNGLRDRLALPLNYADRFGDRSVRVIPYTPPEDGSLTLIRDLLVAASDASSEAIELLLTGDDVRTPGAVNRSPGPIGLEILRRGNANGMSKSLSARIATGLSENAPVSTPAGREIPADIFVEVAELCAPILAEIEQRFGVRPLPGSRPMKRSEQAGASDLEECDAIARALIAAFDGPERHRGRSGHRKPDPPPVAAARRPWVRRLRRDRWIHRMASLLPRRVRARVNRTLDRLQQ